MNDSDRETYLAKGRESEVEVVFDEGKKPKPDPTIRCSAPDGFGGLEGALKKGYRSEGQTLALARWITDSTDGAYVAVLDTDASPDGLALIQSNHNGKGDQTFYQATHADSHGIWLDFCFRAIYTAIEKADEAWSATEITLRHPTNGAWSPELLTVAVEAIRHLTDRKKLTINRIHIGCIHGVNVFDFRNSLRRLDEEQSGDSSAEFREFEVEEVALPEAVGELPGARLFRIPVGRNDLEIKGGADNE